MSHIVVLKTFYFLLPVLSLVMMVVVRYISKVLVWILTILVILGSIGNRPVERCVPLDGFVSASGPSLLWHFPGGTAVLWWLYVDHKKALDNDTVSIFGKEVVADNVKALLGCAIAATIFTVRLTTGAHVHTFWQHQCRVLWIVLWRQSRLQ